MSKKQYFLIVDTETTIKDTVADFSAIVCDRQGRIYTQCAVLVHGHYGNFQLFHDVNSSDEIWTLKGLEKREQAYKSMLENGQRMIASVPAINKWLAKAQEKYNPVLCAYNLAFDKSKASNTGIDLTGFSGEFCLWKASAERLKNNRKFIRYALDNKRLTAKFNFRTNAEVVAEFVLGEDIPPEPHTALEDILGYELPVLVWLVRNKPWHKYKQKSYNWREWQLANLVKPI